MRIVFLNPISEIGGGERSLLSWMAATARAVPDARLALVVPADGPLASAARNIGAEVRIVPIPPALAALGDSALIDEGAPRARLALRGIVAAPTAISYVRRVARALREFQPDVIHSNGIKTHLIVRQAMMLSGRLRRRGSAVTWHIHDFVSHRPLVARALRWASKSITAAAAVSHAVADDARRVLVPCARIEVVYNATDVERFSPGDVPGERLDELAGLPRSTDATTRIVMVATYARWKGQDVFLDAAAAVRRRNPPMAVRFYIVGGPIYQTAGSQFWQDELRRRASEIGLSEHVGFIPFQPDPVEVYRAADIVAHCSTRPEPFGLTIVEAMACGKAVIISAAGGAAELFREGVDGIGVRPGDAEGLAATIQMLSIDASLRHRLGDEARQAALQRFDVRQLTQAAEAFYRSVAS
jgi:glycosyltransferase involved in cell wall biosynthesis